MGDSELRELQLKELEILYEVDRICKKHDIKYFLSWGSVIGAVRHNGFIPWDDDIDISMHWDDYVKFEKVCSKELGERYYFQSNKLKSDYWCPFNKIRINNTSFMLKKYKHMNMHWGIYIDIFPIIPIPDDERQRKRQKFYVSIYNKLIMRQFIRKNYIGKKISPAILYFKIVPRKINEYLKSICLKNITKYDLNKCNFVGEFLSLENTEKIVFDKEIFSEQYFIDFEDDRFPIPIEYDRYLRQCYGDYMKMPDEAQRTGHVGAIIDLEKSYEQYI